MRICIRNNSFNEMSLVSYGLRYFCDRYCQIGLMAIAPLADASTNEWGRMIDINLEGLLTASPLRCRSSSSRTQAISSTSDRFWSTRSLAQAAPSSAAPSSPSMPSTKGSGTRLGGAIRTTVTAPSTVESEAKFGSSHQVGQDSIVVFYEQAIPADAVARAIAFAIEQPADVDINEILVRHTV